MIRFDDVSGPGHPKPLANLVNFSLPSRVPRGQRPDQRRLPRPARADDRPRDRRADVLTQGAVGTAEPERSAYHSVHERLEFSHRDYAQAEYGARLMADRIIGVWQGIGPGAAARPRPLRPLPRRSPVADRSTAGIRARSRIPTRASPTAAPTRGSAATRSCRSSACPTARGWSSGLGTISDVIGVADAGRAELPAIDPGLSTDDFQALGIPVPENYSAPGVHGARGGHRHPPPGDPDRRHPAARSAPASSGSTRARTSRRAPTGSPATSISASTGEPVHRQRRRDLRRRRQRHWDWLPEPAGPRRRLDDQRRRSQRMRAQVNNPANGWNNLENVLDGGVRAGRPTEIHGNYTHDDRCGDRPPGTPCRGGASRSTRLGYKLTVPIGMANDYNGYIATYREYQRGDHYRKALTGWGPHSSDYMATRLVTMGRQLQATRGSPCRPTAPGGAAGAQGRGRHRGQRRREPGARRGRRRPRSTPSRRCCRTTAARPAGRASPEDIERFDAALFTWNGGSNFTDNPVVTVQRESRAAGDDYADQSGEIPVTLEFPALGGRASLPDRRPGAGSGRRTSRRSSRPSTPAAGARNAGRRPTASSSTACVARAARRCLRPESERFEVRPWSGITVEASALEPDGTVSASGSGRARLRRSAAAARGASRPRSGRSTTRTATTRRRGSSRTERTRLRDPERPRSRGGRVVLLHLQLPAVGGCGGGCGCRRDGGGTGRAAGDAREA